MSAAVRERIAHTSKKTVSHGGPISGTSQPGSTANSLENNLDALLEDLQTSVSRSATPNRSVRVVSPQVEYRVASNPTKVVSEERTISPTRSRMTTTEKFVSTGQAGAPSGIPGLEFIDSELQNVQPGQSKTIAYKQVSYQYNKSLDGKPVDSWTADNVQTLPSSTMIDDIRERNYEESTLRGDVESMNKLVNRELVYDDSTLTRPKQTSPLPSTQMRDLKYMHESTSYQAEPAQSSVTTVHTNKVQEYENREYVPVPSPTPAIPINLAPGPNTKVTTTIKTYTYELPGPPENYLQGSNVPGTVVLPGDQTITYTLPKGGSSADKTITVTENVGHRTPSKYSPTPLTDVTKKATTIHQESKFLREEHLGSPTRQPTTTVYHPNSSPLESKTTVTRNEKYYQVDGVYLNGHPPADRSDYPGSTIIYQNQPPTVSDTHTSINRIEKHYSNYPLSDGRHPIPGTPEKPGTPVNYYTTSTPRSTPPSHSTTNVYKYSNTTTTIPPKSSPEEHEVLLPKPFPVDGVQICPTKPAHTVQNPPKKLEELMASFSDTEREVLEDIEKREKVQKEPLATKKEVDFVPHTPPKVQSKNVAGPPIYYPPGAAEFTRKEEASGAMSQSGGAWQKASGKYEYEASGKSKTKSSSGKAVVPVCLPLCCALPCVIM